jgi:protein phosphatase 2C family protein 2/3
METKFKSKFKEDNKTNILKEQVIIKEPSMVNKSLNFSYNPKKLLTIEYPDYRNPLVFTACKDSKIKCYSVNSYKGTVRSYNEDRYKIIHKVLKPESRGDENWPNTSFFAIYDGHGGNKCANFLKENLQHYVKI